MTPRRMNGGQRQTPPLPGLPFRAFCGGGPQLTAVEVKGECGGGTASTAKGAQPPLR